MVVESEVLKALNYALSKFSLPMHSNEEKLEKMKTLYPNFENVMSELLKRLSEL